MSWIKKLYDTYQNCQTLIGNFAEEDTFPLLPLCHTTQKAHVCIKIDQDGNLIDASLIPDREARTIIPCSEKSGGRTSGEAAHPLCDKLQYVAGDYTKYGGTKKSYFESYQNELKHWCQSQFSNPKAIAVLKYVTKSTVIKDLVNHGILSINQDGLMLEKSEKAMKSNVYSLRKINQEEAFVRWEVIIPGEVESKVWKDKLLWDDWSQYYTESKNEKISCLVTGQEEFIADQHPAKIRNDGDKAKLISSNDNSGFTFRGRFLNANQACSISFVATQKAHNALRWLISRQGYKNGEQVILAWATNGKDIPDPWDISSLLGCEDANTENGSHISTSQEFALKLKKKIMGYTIELGPAADIVVMGLDSATPGRMAITYYRELTGSDFLKRICEWHESCSWIHEYGFDPKTRKAFSFIGAPAPRDIVEVVYGTKTDDFLKKRTVQRLIPCIIDGERIPNDIVDSAIRRACNRIGFEKYFEWRKSLSIACALYRKLHEKEKFDMALDSKRNTRDYLYGRLLALADNLEQWALREGSEKRQTNAARLMQRFSQCPFSTWKTIELALNPYKAKLGSKASKLESLITEVIAMFNYNDFICDQKLTGEFLLGYHCQIEALKKRNVPDALNE